jgi:hypothetical protein
MKDFPIFQSMHPVRHVRFHKVWDLVPTDLCRNKLTDMNTTGLLVMNEYFKMKSLLFQLNFCCIQNDILPNSIDWCKNMGFMEPFFNPLHTVVNALWSTMQVYWYLHAPRLSETQVVTLQMLVANAQAHTLVLDVMRKRLLHKAHTKVKDTFKDLNMQEISLMENPKLELLSHLPACIRDNGCDNRTRDTEMGELEMKLVRSYFGSTSKRFSSVEEEMLKRYRNEEFLSITRKSKSDKIDDMVENPRNFKTISSNKSKTSQIQVAEHNELKFYSTRGQPIGYHSGNETFVTMGNESLKIHDLLLEVCCSTILNFLYSYL